MFSRPALLCYGRAFLTVPLTMKLPLLPSLLLLLAPAATAADDMTAPDYADETLTGDWNGARARLFERGVSLDLAYKVDFLRNNGDGLERGGRPINHTDVKLRVDLAKAAGWSGATAYLNLIYDGGGKINAQQVGSLTGVSNTEVPVSTARLYHAWLQQDFAGGRFSLLGGLYPIDSEFQVVDAAAIFVQPPYGATADLALTRGPSIFNNPAFGLRAKWLSADHSAYLQGAVLDGIPGDPKQPRGTHVRLADGDGTMAIVEIGTLPLEAGHTFEPTTPDRGTSMSPELKAHEKAEPVEKYAVGLWRYSAKVADLVDVEADGSPVPRRSWGWYALAERTLYQGEGSRDLVGFVRVSGTDGDSTAIERAANIGIRVRSPLSGRSDDFFGVAYTYARLGSKFRTTQTADGIDVDDHESAWEIGYRLQAAKWLVVQPLLQRIRHPSGNRDLGTARIAGARVEVAF